MDARGCRRRDGGRRREVRCRRSRRGDAQTSTLAGLRALPERCAGAFVHDGARPLVRAQDVRRAMRRFRGPRVAARAPVVDTIEVIDAHNRTVQSTLDRAVLWAAQTPQFASAADMRRAHEAGVAQGADATDDASCWNASA